VADAEDITQESFLVLIRKPAAFDPSRAQLRTWLIAVVKRQHLGRLRGSQRELDMEEFDEIAQIADGATNFVDELIRMERAEAVRQAMASLPRAQQEALYLFEFEGLSLSQIAEILNIEANAVKARLFRARAQLKHLLTPQESAR
jgi:RNA polymerase sigma-70 factor (ECF subfamily)